MIFSHVWTKSKHIFLNLEYRERVLFGNETSGYFGCGALILRKKQPNDMLGASRPCQKTCRSTCLIIFPKQRLLEGAEPWKDAQQTHPNKKTGSQIWKCQQWEFSWKPSIVNCPTFGFLYLLILRVAITGTRYIMYHVYTLVFQS